MQIVNHIVFLSLATALGLTNARGIGLGDGGESHSYHKPPQTKTAFYCPEDKPEGYCGFTPPDNQGISEGRVVTINRVIDAYIVELRSYSCRDKPLEKLLCCDRKTMIYYPEVPISPDKTLRVDLDSIKSIVTLNKIKSLEESIVAACPSIASTIANNFPNFVLSWTGYCMYKFRSQKA
ncbi:hypothetical protein MJO28_000355 [Puccinia striiformis f. sp. tritici]|uniref:Uncharacterized protein n=3 Tax=Puccinia striiformis TaxID=27350 RepID=A0A2S4UW69_9BASI|nr:hypothetical protein Pst134EB_002097 [Puccinia striiformis f. sp. tritici]KAI7962261.1 hypothetical protein MJO28_000355 [Puccinia striiformis f. sp. tritici]KAI9600903.1 hypothetical protein H4Q26_000697 [Puccinia striiformis f. sp. tritici PST-130]POW01527.1 hypothetical protein PSTT_12426 [Puccinia striiformis]POW08613.1 hypothetical protein PSHT_09486 [Puccinia striiformis]